MKERKIVITSGYYNPVHRGHVEYLQLAKRLFFETYHIAIVNNEKQSLDKKGRVVIPLEDRTAVVEAIRYVDEVFISIDEDKSVCKSLEYLAKQHTGEKIVFAKGGDRYSGEIPEKKVCDQYNIEIIDGLGEKIQSSSEITRDWGER